MASAITYARKHDVTSAIAILDTRTGNMTTAGPFDESFAAASVAKVLIATQLLLEGKMHGEDASLAHVMITRSDNDAADTLYPLVDGDDLLPTLAKHYDVDLGAGPAHPGLWGSTRITARGMAAFYGKVRSDPRVWPWLSAAMHAHEATTEDGEPNDFGLGELDDAAVKNGWNDDDDPDEPQQTDINTTGFVDGDRYAVVILARGPDRLYYAGGEAVVSAETRILFPKST